jgi:copper(I)-binding protein
MKSMAYNYSTKVLMNAMVSRVRAMADRVGLHRVMAFVLLALANAVSAQSTSAQNIQVKDAWVRGTVPAQRGTGAFMDISAKQAVRLVSVDSPVASSVEIHNMTMTNGVMKMFPVDGLNIPTGKTVKLAPGGYHVMMMGLKQQMKAGEQVPLKLTFELPDKTREVVEISVEVRDITGKPAHH